MSALTACIPRYRCEKDPNGSDRRTYVETDETNKQRRAQKKVSVSFVGGSEWSSVVDAPATTPPKEREAVEGANRKRRLNDAVKCGMARLMLFYQLDPPSTLFMDADGNLEARDQYQARRKTPRGKVQPGSSLTDLSTTPAAQNHPPPAAKQTNFPAT